MNWFDIKIQNLTKNTLSERWVIKSFSRDLIVWIVLIFLRILPKLFSIPSPSAASEEVHYSSDKFWNTSKIIGTQWVTRQAQKAKANLLKLKCWHHSAHSSSQQLSGFSAQDLVLWFTLLFFFFSTGRHSKNEHFNNFIFHKKWNLKDKSPAQLS